MSFSNYNLSWSDQLVERTETHLRDLHSALLQYYESKGYETQVEDYRSSAVTGTAKLRNDGDEEIGREQDRPAASLDVVSPVGSFLLRTCVYGTPFQATHSHRSTGADLVLSIPASLCSLADQQEGRYLECRHAFLLEIEAYLRQLIEGAQRRVAQNGTEEGEEEEGEEGQMSINMAAAARLSRMMVERQAIHGCYALGEKHILLLRFHRRASSGFETFDVKLHFRPAIFSGRVGSPAMLRKHPYYSYLILEDHLMPHYLKKLHQLCVDGANVRRAIVVLKCWAHHVGLMAAASGHPEGLNGFVVSAMVMRLLEDGIVSQSMAFDNIVRSVWVHISRGFFLTSSKKESSSIGAVIVPAAEVQGDVSVLRFVGEVHNVLFRTSSAFMKHVIIKAAEEALQHTSAMDAFTSTAFLPLPLRHDVALIVQLHTENGTEKTTWVTGEVDRSAEAFKKSGVWQAPRVYAAQQALEVLCEAFRARSSFVTAWYSSPDTMQIAVQLTTESDGRNRLTRGPAIEDTAAVEAFNQFWGIEVTSTRQFSDGAIYRCVLWDFPEESNAHTTVSLSASTVLRRVAEYAIRRHTAPSATVGVLLGGLEGLLAERIGVEFRDASTLMQKSLLDASKAVQHMIQHLPRGCIPCRIASFDVISASERHTEVFPVRPHYALTYTTDNLDDAAFTGLSTAPTVEPIHCVLNIDDNHKIPDTVEAIAMMKGAICAQLAKALEQQFGEAAVKLNKKKPQSGGAGDTAVVVGPIRTLCTSQSVDILYRGFLFRIYVAHYREVSLLRALKRETEADVLEQKLHWSVLHTKFLRTIAFGHHSYATAVRLAKRWISAMMLYEFVLPEAVELLVAYAYLMPNNTPKTSASGFLRFLQLLATHDWTTPLVLPFTDDDSDKSTAAAAAMIRKLGEHQGMYIAAPYAPTASPFTLQTPRPMIMSRLTQLAQGAVTVLLQYLEGRHRYPVEMSVFTSDPRAFDFCMKFHPRLMLQPDRTLCPLLHMPDASAIGGSCTSAAVAAASEATAANTTLLRIWQLDELDASTSGREYINQLVEREPAAHAVRTIRAALREQGMMFYDALAPSYLYIISIASAPQLRRSQHLHAAILQLSRGALLPAPADAFQAATPQRTPDAGEKTPTGSRGSASGHAPKGGKPGKVRSPQHKKRVRDESASSEVGSGTVPKNEGSSRQASVKANGRTGGERATTSSLTPVKSGPKTVAGARAATPRSSKRNSTKQKA